MKRENEFGKLDTVRLNGNIFTKKILLDVKKEYIEAAKNIGK